MREVNWKLRKAAPEDRPEIEDLFLEMLRTIYQTEPASGYEAGYLDKFFRGGGDWVCVAEWEKRVVAFLSIEEHREQTDYLYLDDLSVRAAFRGRGIGTELLQAAGRYAGERGISLLVLHTEKTNSSAIRLYRRQGFEILAEEGERYKMIKVLPPRP